MKPNKKKTERSNTNNGQIINKDMKMLRCFQLKMKRKKRSILSFSYFENDWNYRLDRSSFGFDNVSSLAELTEFAGVAWATASDIEWIGTLDICWLVLFVTSSSDLGFIASS